MKKSIRFFIVALLFPFLVRAQEMPSDSLKTLSTDSSTGWEFYAEADYYIFPTETNILTLITTANKGILHLEARYNYEDRYSASVFGGLNFAFGNQLKFVLTPIAGFVFGRLNAAAPGLETELSYKKLSFNSQSEWVIDFSGKQGNFLFTFLQLGAGITDKFVLGITAQRTRLYETKKDIQRGIFAQYSFGNLNTSLSYFNPFSTDYFFMAMVSIDF